MSVQVSSQNTGINKSEVYALLKKVADWQIKTPLKYATADWTNGALFTGMAEWAKIAKEDTYYGWLKEMGENSTGPIIRPIRTFASLSCG